MIEIKIRELILLYAGMFCGNFITVLIPLNGVSTSLLMAGERFVFQLIPCIFLIIFYRK